MCLYFLLYMIVDDINMVSRSGKMIRNNAIDEVHNTIDLVSMFPPVSSFSQEFY
tara:strand:- start:498 stop:659 length:162 start_codon:yes stop_codon:yes gene_type:complete